MPTDRA